MGVRDGFAYTAGENSITRTEELNFNPSVLFFPSGKAQRAHQCDHRKSVGTPLVARHEGCLARRLSHAIEECFRCDQIAGVEAFGEPVIYRREKFTGLARFPLLQPQFGEIGGGAKFE